MVCRSSLVPSVSGRCSHCCSLVPARWCPRIASSMWVYVSGLRAALEPARAKRSDGTVLLTRAPGYVVSINPEDTDVGRFERSVANARDLAANDPRAAAVVWRAALAMWHGRAYEEFTYESWAQGEIGRLEELRLEAIENRIDADLRLGLARETVSELTSLSREHPLREHLVTSLMLALYRSGRATEALRASSAYCRRLVDEFGVEPSRAVRDIEHRILNNHPDLTIDEMIKARARASRPRSALTVRG
jgi:DNA-binding SARP family transcriptional activator